ncbi:MAG: asparagine synthase (glutamine-hydrolyzing) [Alphaproteobacteria bacterium]|nr:asparagine synthase (glutamine-hydrolyzing) [Alphaproteobacteria bacterium]
MCGITGFLHYNNSRSRDELDFIVKAMAEQIKERGPDDGGQWIDAEYGVALGHRRLSIVDLSPAGHQPMVSACGRYVLVYNGEIYNAPDLKTDILKEHRVSFRGNSDTEVLLEGCALWGVANMVKKCIGMFAFALWDRRTNSLTLVRDRMGIKPLYWGWQGQGNDRTFFFGSQLKSLTPHPCWNPKINQSIVTSYLRYGYVPAPRSIYQEMNQLDPGHILTLTQGGEVTIEAYWRLEDYVTQDPTRCDPDQSLDQLETVLKDAVGRRMVADVPLGAFLSGGIDSSLVVSLMQSQSARPIKTFSIGFGQAEYNEAHYAKEIADHLGTEHTEMYLPVEQAADIIPEIPRWFDEPFADSSQIPTYLVSKMAREHVTVSLSGDGGDELFAGYNRYFYTKQLWNKFSWMPPALKKPMAAGVTAFSEETWDAVGKCMPERLRPKYVGQKAHKFAKIMQSSTEEGFYQALVSQSHNPEKYSLESRENPDWAHLLKRKDFPCLISYMQYLDMKTYLPNDILTKVDRASMAVSLEARVPLLDHRVVEFAAAMPLDLKIRNQKAKWPLRQLLERHVPARLFERPKTGFGIPIHDWLRGRLRDWGEDLLSENSLKDAGMLNPKTVRTLWENYQKGENQEAYALWSMLMLQAWQRHKSLL